MSDSPSPNGCDDCRRDLAECRRYAECGWEEAFALAEELKRQKFLARRWWLLAAAGWVGFAMTATFGRPFVGNDQRLAPPARQVDRPAERGP